MAANLLLNSTSITVRQAADELGCSRSFVYKLMKVGQLAYEKRGRYKRPLVASVDHFRLRNLVPATHAPPLPGEPMTSAYTFKHLFQKKTSASKERGGEAD